MSDHYVPFEELRRGVDYEFTLDDGEKLLATFDEYAPAFGAKSLNPPGGDFARVRDTEGRQHSLPREQVSSIRVV
jgi:hypothetical protein